MNAEGLSMVGQRDVVVWVAAVAGFCASMGAPRAQQQPDVPVFRSAVELVAVSAVVRDRRGRYVTSLDRSDFEVLDAGERRRIVEFRSDGSAPASVALLVDSSGSMRVGSSIYAARDAVNVAVNRLVSGRDEAALFSFERALEERRAFTTNAREVLDALPELVPFGTTSLYDAIADAARRLVARRSPRRALVVLTDGIDTSSQLSPADASRAASAIDTPVYVIALVSPIDRTKGTPPDDDLDPDGARGELAALARSTGGRLFVSSAPSHISVAMERLLEELRHQYLIAFESAGSSGWRQIEVRTRRRDLIVRARSGYFAGPAS